MWGLPSKIAGIFENVTKRSANLSEGGNKAALQALGDVKRLKEACDIAERIFSLTDPVACKFDDRVNREYWKLREKFNEKD